MEFFAELIKSRWSGEQHDHYTLKSRKEYFEHLVAQLDKPFIVAFTGIPFIELETKHFEGDMRRSVHDYLLSLSGIEFVAGNFMERLYSIAIEDEEWTKKHNEKHLYVTHRKLTLKPYVQVAAAKQFKELIQELDAVLTEIETKRQAEKQAREELHAQYRISKVHSLQMPTSGEDGYDGFKDMVIVNTKTGEEVRFIYRDIFDFGVFTFPARFDGVRESIFSHEGWTEEEKKMSKWIYEFGEFSNPIRM